MFQSCFCFLFCELSVQFLCPFFPFWLSVFFLMIWWNLYSRDNIFCWLYDLQIFFTSVHVSFEFIFGRLCHSDFLCSQIYKFLFKGFFGIMGHDYKGTFWVGASQCSLAIQFEVDFEYVQLYCSQALHKGWKILVILVRLRKLIRPREPRARIPHRPIPG